MSGSGQATTHTADGRRRAADPCAYGHTVEAKECPSCYERLYGGTAEPAWWKWFEKRYPKAAAKRVRLQEG
jgi:hypothetical protein